MRGTRAWWSSLVLILCLAAAGATKVARGQSGPATSATVGEWRSYAADLKGTRYSALDQIDGTNFAKMEIGWRFKTDIFGPRPEFRFQATPLVANGVMYFAAGTRKVVVAVDPSTGELLWSHRESEGARADASPRQLSGRGVTYWTDGKDERIFYVTQGYRLVALDAKTGISIASFGQQGSVDLKRDFDQEIDLVTGDVGLHAAPVVTGNTIIVGAAHTEGSVPKSKTNAKGYVRAFDVRTGKRLWTFHTIPSPGEFGNDTWLKDSWSYTGNTGVWSQITVDEELGLAYLPVETPTGDYYGGHRPGNNLFGESLVAVDIRTGKRKWHYQMVHHGIWDLDVSSAPILADITVDGRPIKAVVVPSKQAFLYVFDRVTGQPVWPIEERPVPKGDVPGEWYAPTQPFPTKPPAYDRQGVTIDDLIDFTPELRAEGIKVASKYQLGPLFQPPVLSKAEGPFATLTLGGYLGGTNWPGGSYDPESHTVFVYSQSNINTMGLVKPDPKQSDMDFIRGIAAPPAAQGLTVQGLPLVKPPYSRISAINLDRAEILWQTPHGDTPDVVRNHPALKGMNIPRTGQNGHTVGTLVTKTLVVAGDPTLTTTDTHPRGAMLRGYDKLTGKEVGAVLMPAPVSGSPMTYSVNGRQHVAIAISGGNYPGELLVFRLPAPEKPKTP